MKKACQVFTTAYWSDQVQHFFTEAKDSLANKGFCVMHGKHCDSQGSRACSPDFTMFGSPCDPFTAARNNHKAVPAHKHHMFNLTFSRPGSNEGGVCEHLGKHKPRSWAAEQVMGFGKSVCPEDRTPWLKKFVQRASDITDQDGQQLYTVRVIKLTAGDWLADFQRDRCLV